MPHEPLRAVLDFLRKISATKEMHDLADADLLQRFVVSRDEIAFAALVHRHGPMVLSVCQRVLGDFHSAEDAFQATFMVLVRKAASLRKRELLGNWLYGVAQRVASKARAKAAAFQNRQRELTDMPRPEPLDDLTWQELRPILDEEIGRLPEKYRAPIVLCYLQGKSHEQAAKELGWPRRSFSSRLDHARDLLRRKLTGRGVALSAGALTATLAEKTAGEAVGAMLIINTAKAAASVAAGKAVPATILSAEALALTREVLKGMVAMKVKLSVLVLACSLTIGGTGLAVYQKFGGYEPGEVTTPPMPDAVASANRAQRQSLLADPQKTDTPAVIDSKKVEARSIDLHGDPLPPGAMARAGTVRFRHGGFVNFAALLPDGKTVLTSGAETNPFAFGNSRPARKSGAWPNCRKTR